MSVWLCQIAKFLFYKEIKKNKKLKFEDIDRYSYSIGIVKDSDVVPGSLEGYTKLTNED